METQYVFTKDGSDTPTIDLGKALFSQLGGWVNRNYISNFTIKPASDNVKNRSAYLQDQFILDHLENSYQLVEPFKVLEMIRAQEIDVSYLLSLPENIHRFFDREELAISVIEDPEYLDKHLGIIISTARNHQDAFDLLERMDNEWWLEEENEGKGVQIHIEFQ